MVVWLGSGSDWTVEENLYIGRANLSSLRFFNPLFWGRALSDDWRALCAGRFVLLNLVKTQLTTRYHRSSLGFLWTLLHPVLMLTVQAFVFSNVFRMNFADFVVYLFSGMVAFQFFSSALDLGSKSMLSHEGLLRKVSISKFICPLADMIGAAVNLILATTALFVIVWVVAEISGGTGASAAATTAGGARPGEQVHLPVGLGLHIQFIIYPIAALLLGLFCFGMALVCMTVVVWFRDFEHMLTVFLGAMYFAIPIIYPISFVSPDILRLLKLNPVLHHVRLFQHAIALGTWPELETWIWAVVSTLVSLVVGYVVYKVFEDDYIYRL